MLFLLSASPSTESSHLTLFCSLQKACGVESPSASGKRWRPNTALVLEGILRPAFAWSVSCCCVCRSLLLLASTSTSLVTLQLQTWSRITKCKTLMMKNSHYLRRDDCIFFLLSFRWECDVLCSWYFTKKSTSENVEI